MERLNLALVAIALLLSIIEGGRADQFHLRSASPRPNEHAADAERRALGIPPGGGGGGGGGGSSGGSSSSSSGGGSSSSGSESSSGGGSESSSGGDSSGSESSSGGDGSGAEEDEEIPGWLAKYFGWMGVGDDGGDDGSDIEPDAGTRSFWSPTGSFATGENGEVDGFGWAMMALTAFVAGLAFVVARRSCRDGEDDGGPKRKRRWRRGILARKVPVGEDGEEFVEMSFIPMKFTKNGWKKREAGAGAAKGAAGYKAPPAADGLRRESSSSSASSGLPAAYSLANSSSSSSASSSVVVV